MRWVPFIRRGHPRVSVLRLNGVIASGAMRNNLNLASMAKLIEQAFSQKGIKAVALDINSPGGSPVQSSLLYSRIRALATEKKIPVFAFAQDVAASGGYWLACAADTIYADTNSIIGSIGVMSGGFGFQEIMEKIGVERRLYASGNRKSFLDPFLPEKKEDVARLKILQAEIHDSFKDLVRTRRAGKLKKSEEVLFTGEFWTGKKALELGLVDGVGDLRSIMRERYGNKVHFKVFAQGSGWLRRRIGLNEIKPVGSTWAEDLFAAAESRLLWSRFGL